MLGKCSTPCHCKNPGRGGENPAPLVQTQVTTESHSHLQQTYRMWGWLDVCRVNTRPQGWLTLPQKGRHTRGRVGGHPWG